jgi:uncharacterized caspase-like protein
MKTNGDRCFGRSVRVALAVGLMVLGLSGLAVAGPHPTPEIDAGSMAAAVTLLGGAVLVVTNRVRRK